MARLFISYMSGGLFDAFEDVDDDHVAYHKVPGTKAGEDKVVVFDLSDSTSGVMKRRGRKKETAAVK